MPHRSVKNRNFKINFENKRFSFYGHEIIFFRGREGNVLNCLPHAQLAFCSSEFKLFCDIFVGVRASNKLDVPRFNTRYMKDSIKYRGAVLWNTMTAKHRDLAQSSSFGSLKKKLNNLVTFRDFDFSITSAQTSNFRRDGFTYY